MPPGSNLFLHLAVRRMPVVAGVIFIISWFKKTAVGSLCNKDRTSYRRLLAAFILNRLADVTIRQEVTKAGAVLISKPAASFDWLRFD